MWWKPYRKFWVSPPCTCPQIGCRAAAGSGTSNMLPAEELAMIFHQEINTRKAILVDGRYPVSR